VFVGLVIQHVKRTRHIVICSLPGRTIIYRSIPQISRLEKKVIECEMFRFSLQFCLKYFQF